MRTPTKEMGRFAMTVRVYLEDTDAQGVVYNASYFRFMERARTECLRDKGIDHDHFRDEYGANLVLAKIEARFIAPSRLSDVLLVEANVADIRGARIVFEQSVRRVEGGDAKGGALICQGRAEVACMDAATNRPRRFPGELVNKWLQ
jgi:tol-pal system-associated acyl-CoA thioesterase